MAINDIVISLVFKKLISEYDNLFTIRCKIKLMKYCGIDFYFDNSSIYGDNTYNYRMDDLEYAYRQYNKYYKNDSICLSLQPRLKKVINIINHFADKKPKDFPYDMWYLYLSNVIDCDDAPTCCNLDNIECLAYKTVNDSGIKKYIVDKNKKSDE